MNREQLLFEALSLDYNYQHFFYLDDEGNLKTTMEGWPEQKNFSRHEPLSAAGFHLLLRLMNLVSNQKNIKCTRGAVYNAALQVTKSAAVLDQLLQYLHEKGYVTFQVEGRQRYIILNPYACVYMLT